MSNYIYNKEIISDLSDGAKDKYLCKDISGKYIYKSDKINSYGEHTYESLSEYLSYLLCCQLSIPCCPIEIVEHGCFSKIVSNEDIKSFIELSEEMSHSFHLSNLTTFNISTLLTESTNPYWKDVIQMLLFDALIGNSDRHPGNFGYTEKGGFYPLYDNGCSLLCYIRDCDIDNILNDRNRFDACVTTKSKPVARDNSKITHEQLVRILSKQYPKLFDNFCYKVSLLNINNLKSSRINEDRWNLIREFLLVRMRWFE